MRALASWSTSFRQASSARCVLHQVREVFYLGHVFAFDQPFLHIFIIHFFDARFLSIRSSVKLPAGRELKCSKKHVFLNELLCKISFQTSKQTNNILPPLRFSGLSHSSVHKHVFRSLFFLFCLHWIILSSFIRSSVHSICLLHFLLSKWAGYFIKASLYGVCNDCAKYTASLNSLGLWGGGC